MTDTPSASQIFVARVAVVLIVGLAVAGVAFNGFSVDQLKRLWASILERPGGPMTFRFVLQPAMALLMAWRDGVKDARMKRTPYLVVLAFGTGQRQALLWEGIVSTARILILGVVMDVVYQFIVTGTFRPGQAAIIAVLLAFVPYLLARGPIGRVATMMTRSG